MTYIALALAFIVGLHIGATVPKRIAGWHRASNDNRADDIRDRIWRDHEEALGILSDAG